MGARVHWNSLSAWRGLCETAGLEIDGRDEALAGRLKEELDPGAPDLDSALATATMERFLQALFQTIQPFVGMFRDILSFFERAGARYGQAQWRVRIADEFVDLRHFEEFVAQWRLIWCGIDVPALDRDRAFIINDVRHSRGSPDYLRGTGRGDKPADTGLPDADAWLAAHAAGQYAPFPPSLHPDRLPPGLDDTARVAMAALSVLRHHGLTREQMLAAHRARSCASIAGDAFHPWTIAQCETDFWLYAHVLYLANLMGRPENERKEFGLKLAEAYSIFPRRKFDAQIEIEDFERLLSLPAWAKRHEAYGVWVATRIVGALDDHTVELHHDGGAMRFAFAEAKIADVESAVPKLSLFSERKSPLADPIGKSRTSAVQPDYGIWTRSVHAPECKLVVEVKHYKKRSRRNFRDALIDYSCAHPDAKVVLVNYGPVGKEFTDLPGSVRGRCRMIGHFNPDNVAAQAEFRDVVRACVGDPATDAGDGAVLNSSDLIAIDISGSMAPILGSAWFRDLLEGLPDDCGLALVDQHLRDVVTRNALGAWLGRNELGRGTSLADPIAALLGKYETVMVLTDEGGLNDLRTLTQAESVPVSGHPCARFVRLRRPA